MERRLVAGAASRFGRRKDVCAMVRRYATKTAASENRRARLCGTEELC